MRVGGKCVLDNNRGEFSLCLHLRWSDCQRRRAAMGKYVRSSKVGTVLRITTPQDGETDLGRSGWTGNCACDNNKKSVSVKARYNVDCVGAKGREMCAE